MWEGVGETLIAGIVLAMGYSSLGLLPKALIEEVKFRDRESAKKTMLIWLVSMLSLSAAVGFTLFLEYFG